MRWLKRKLRRWLDDDSIVACEPAIIRSNHIDIDGISFNVMQATGGVIVQTRQYNSKTDRNMYSTHIITDQENLSERIGQIVSIELLKSL